MPQQLQRLFLFSFILLLTTRAGTIQAQSPGKEAARAARITTDLLTLPNGNAASTSSEVRGLEKLTRFQMRGDQIAIEAAAAPNWDANTLLQALQSRGLTDGRAYGQLIFGYLPVSQLNALKDVPSLRFARPAYKPVHSAGRVTSQGDKAFKADLARQTYGVTGARSKVGILSDSYNALGGAAAGVASGDLPANVQVLEEYREPGASDEGRAMAEIVHDVAPGASMAFNTAFTGQAGFAQGIKNLAAAGCNIIVDDVSYFAEPFFQDGVIAQAVDEVVTNNNVTYFSSAGNSGRSSYQSSYRNGGPLVHPTYGFQGYAHDFGGGDIYQRITIPPGGQVIIGFQWDDPFASVSGGAGARTDMDLLVYYNGIQIPFLSSANANIGGDPVEISGYANTSNAPISLDLVLIKYEGPDPGLIKWINFGTPVSIEYDTQSSTTFGHSNAARAIAVAAARYTNTPAFNPSLTTALVEDFSSAGGTPTLFTTAGTRINGVTGITRPKPELTGPNGGNNTFFGDDFEGDGFPNFFGTSASAPHVAAVAALMQERAGNSLAPSSVLSLLEETALDMDDPLTPGFDLGFDYRTGYGFVQADRAVRSVATGQPLALVQPLFNCRTGAITFQTTGGDGSRIEYQGIGITDWNPNPNQFLDAPVLADQNSKTVLLKARQSGREVTYLFDFRAYCQGSNGNQPPVLAIPIENQFAQRGAYFAFQFPANTFSDPNNDALTYTATGLPDGLTFDTANRRISGTPSQAGTFPVTIVATDPGTLSARAQFTLTVAPNGTTRPLALVAPLYDCGTGAITFRTVEGDGSPIMYFAIGIARNAPTDASGTVEAELRADPKPIVIQATQSGVTVSYTFDLPGACGSTVANFRLIEPAYSCATGLFTFRVANVAPGKTVEYYSVPGITGWTTNPTHQFDSDLRTAGDVKPFILRARYVGEPASEVTLEWVRPTPCSAGARLAASEATLQVIVLENPTAGEFVELNATGIEGPSLQLRVLDSRGVLISDQRVQTNESTSHQRVSIGRSPGLYLLNVGTSTQQKTVKIIRQ
ncbi:putative Ig domain-containing protein [Spirosoma pomorum]